MNININKNIDKYKESIVMGLTAKQLIFSCLSLLVGGGIVGLSHRYVGLTISAYISVPFVVPVALEGFYTYNGMSFHELIKKKLHFMFKNKTLTYVSTENEQVIKDIQQSILIENKKNKKNSKRKKVKNEHI